MANGGLDASAEALGSPADAHPDADMELVRRAQAGDAEAFGTLIERHRRAVYRAVYAALGSTTEADDVAQDAFVAAYQRLQSFRGQAAFRTWLLTIAWRKALDRRRSVARWVRLTIARGSHDADPAQGVVTLASSAVSQEDAAMAGELRLMVQRLIRTLPARLRDALLLAASAEYSYEQISGILGTPVGTVKWRVSEARRVLKQKLAALGYDT